MNQDRAPANIHNAPRSSQRRFSGVPDNMPTRPIDEQLDKLRDKILLLGGSTEAMVERAMRALVERNSELASSVQGEDRIIDQMELEIDRLSIDILASQQPTEHDL